jgi:SAM-dependent methyltransferase
MPMAVNVQYGCGLSCPEGWINFDASPVLRLQKLPVVGGVVRRYTTPFPPAVRYGDIVGGLPFPDNSVDHVYASHVLEHLSLSDFERAVQNTHRMLKQGGVFRLIVPDLEYRARRYLEKIDGGDSAASIWFMRATLLGLEKRPRSIMGFARNLIGNSAHLWMWDRHSIAEVLTKVGFINVRRCQIGDSLISAFTAVEEEDRFYDRQHDFHECALEAHKGQA